MNRYNNTKVKINENNNRVFETSVFDSKEKTSEDIYFMSKLYDRLDKYAAKYYDGQVSKWVIIAQANQLGKGSLMVPPGLHIRIPMSNSNVKLEDI